MTRVSELAQLATERHEQFARTWNEIASRPALPAFAAAGLTLAAALGAKRLATALVGRLSGSNR